MNTPDESDDVVLRARFAALRGAESRAAPSFDALLAAAPRRRSPSLAFGAAAALFVAAVLIVRPDVEHTDVATFAVATVLPDEMPSDFLLSSERRDIRRAPPRVNRRANDEVPFL